MSDTLAKAPAVSTITQNETMPAREALNRFLDAASAEGYVFANIDAADLYVALFPEEYERACAIPSPDAIAAQPKGVSDEMIKEACFIEQRRWMEEAGIDTEGMRSDEKLLSHLVTYCRAAMALRPEAQPLTDQQIVNICEQEAVWDGGYTCAPFLSPQLFTRAIEVAHGIVPAAKAERSAL